MIKNIDKAAYWYGKAMEQGHTEATYKMGVFTYYGKGMKHSKKKALPILQLAASKGSTDAELFIAEKYTKKKKSKK